jgi:uncharacterized protein involved in exopolysaccharide biosynthesis
MTKVYESRAVIVPVVPVEEQGGGMSAVAAQFGITTPQSSNLSEIVGLLKSDIIMQKVMEKGKFRDVLFDKDDLEGLSENEKTWKGIRILKEQILNVKENKKDNIITISAEYKDPVIAQKIASTALMELTEHMTAEARRVAEANRVYLESQINTAGDPFIRTNVYGLIARQIQTAMLAEAKENYAFKVLDPPRVPDKKVKPKRVLMVGIAFVVSLFLGIFLAFMREHYQRNREEWAEIGRMSGLRRFSWKRSHA